jgi:hypothetical protein
MALVIGGAGCAAMDGAPTPLDVDDAIRARQESRALARGA